MNPKNWWKCDINTGWENTWRSAAYHFAEGFPGGEWTVTGYHYGLAPDKRTAILLSITTATDCNIYDGWWDQ